MATCAKVLMHLATDSQQEFQARIPLLPLLRLLLSLLPLLLLQPPLLLLPLPLQPVLLLYFLLPRLLLSVPHLLPLTDVLSLACLLSGNRHSWKVLSDLAACPQWLP